jgi:hypothetical protein
LLRQHWPVPAGFAGTGLAAEKPVKLPPPAEDVVASGATQTAVFAGGYRSAVFYRDADQKRVTEHYIAQLDAAKVFSIWWCDCSRKLFRREADGRAFEGLLHEKY